MGRSKTLCFFVALAIIKLTAAESGEDAAAAVPSSEEQQRAPMFSLGSMPLFMSVNPFGSGSGSGGMPDISSIISGFMPGSGSGSGGLPDFMSLFGNLMNSGGSRNKRSAEHEDGHGHGREHGREDGHGHGREHGREHGRGPAGDALERFMFRFPVLVPCNFTAQGENSCLSCTQALRCRSNNVGTMSTCRGILPYCNNGRCSFFPGSACFNSTALSSGSGSAASFSGFSSSGSSSSGSSSSGTSSSGSGSSGSSGSGSSSSGSSSSGSSSNDATTSAPESTTDK